MHEYRRLNPPGCSVLALLLAAIAPVMATSYVTSSAGDWATPAIWTPNGVPGAADTATVNHAVTMAAEQSIGAVNIGAAGSLTPGPGVNLNVSADWRNDGTFNEGTGCVTFNDTTNITGTGAHRFHRVSITCYLKGPGLDMTITGVWRCTGEYRHGAGRVIFAGDSVVTNSQRFFRVDINRPAGGNVVLGDDLQIGDSLRVFNGTLVMGAHTLWLGGTARNCGAFVYGPGAISIVGASPAAPGKVVSLVSAYPYSLTIMPGATIASRYAEFTGVDKYGIVVREGAVVDSENDFSDCAFDHGASDSGPMLKIENNQVLDIENVGFDAGAGWNIEKLGAAGHITVHGGTGNYWGDSLENDPNNLVDWRAGAVEESPGVGPRLGGAATVVRGVLLLPRAAAKPELLDAAGRTVMTLTPGPNDLSRLGPGVYFVSEGRTRSVRRVVLAE
jgi:hypothetical protein